MSNRIHWAEPNGDFFSDRWFANCAICGKYVLDMHPSEEDENGDTICMDCAYIHKYISEQEYIDKACYHLPDITRAVIHEGKVCPADDHKLPWEKTKKEQRQSPAYKQWRAEVFERDSYKCAICGQVGGELNAHHIKPFSKFPDLRLNVDNGITLCEKCHKQVHREKKDEWLHTGEPNNTE